jgi:release factor glutamine methyltransferase
MQQWTVASILDWTQDYFSRNNVSEPRLDAEVLLSAALNCDRLKLYVENNKVLREESISVYKKYISERKTGKPVSYILGEKEFMGFVFKVNSSTLIPRPETEILVENVIKLIDENNLKTALDLGAGSGNISVSIAKLSKIEKVFSVDISYDALSMCWQNVLMHNQAQKINLRHGDLFDAVKADNIEYKVDIIVSNPPYIADYEFPSLAVELSFEPKSALWGGADGLDYYKKIAQQAKRYLSKNGYVAVELNSNKSSEISKIFSDNEFKIELLQKDYSGLDRVLIGRI